jgi:hypothetical protein
VVEQGIFIARRIVVKQSFALYANFFGHAGPKQSLKLSNRGASTMSVTAITRTKFTGPLHHIQLASVFKLELL